MTRLKEKVRDRIFRRIFEKQGLLMLGEKVTKMICLHLFEYLRLREKVALVKALRWELKKNRRGYDFDPVRKRIESFKNYYECGKFIVAALCAKDLLTEKRPETLEYFAMSLEIDPLSVEKEVRDELVCGKRGSGSEG